MAKNLENINKVRIEKGLPPLEKLPEGSGEGGNNGGGQPPAGDPPPVQQSNPPAGDPPPARQNDPPAADPDADIADERILQALKKKGIQVSSLDELVPRPDPAQQAEQREVNKLSYGLNKGLYSVKEHESFVREKNNPRDVVFADYFERAKQEDSTLTDEEIQAEFEERYGMNAEPGTRKFKLGQEEIAARADRLLRDRYKKIFSADEAYTQYEASENAKQSRNQTILQKAPAYKRDVDTVFAGLKMITIPVSESESYEVEVPEEILNEVKELFLQPDASAKQIVGGYTPDTIKELAYTTLLRKGFSGIFAKAAQQYHLKRQAGTRGILPVGPQAAGRRRILTEQQRQMLAEAGKSEDDLPPLNVN